MEINATIEIKENSVTVTALVPTENQSGVSKELLGAAIQKPWHLICVSENCPERGVLLGAQQIATC